MDIIRNLGGMRKSLLFALCFFFVGSSAMVFAQRSLPAHLEFVDCRNQDCMEETMYLMTLVEEGKAKKATKFLQKRVLQNSKDVNALLLLGYINEFIGEYDKSIQAYNAAIRVDPNNAHTYFMLGNTYLKAGRFKLAYGNYMRTVDKDPLYYEAYNNMALIRLKNQGQSGIVDNDYVLARRDLDRVLSQAAGGDDRVFFNLGMVHANIKLYDDALDYFTRAIDNCNDCGKSYFYRGLCNFYLRDYKSAFSDIEESIALEHDDPRSNEMYSLLETIMTHVDQN